MIFLSQGKCFLPFTTQVIGKERFPYGPRMVVATQEIRRLQAEHKVKEAGGSFGFLPTRAPSRTIGNTLNYCRNEVHDL